LGSSGGGAGRVTVHSPWRTISQPDGPLATAIAPESRVVIGEADAAGLDDAPGKPVEDELIGPVELVGPAVVDGLELEPAEAPAHPAAMTMTARIDCHAMDLDTRMNTPYGL